MDIDQGHCPNCGHDVLNWALTCPGCDQVPWQTTAAQRLVRAHERKETFRRWRRVVLVAALIAVGVWAEHLRALREDQSLPPLRAEVLEALDLGAYQGKLVVLEFWASWCGPCRAEAPRLVRLHDELRALDRVAMVGVSLDTSCQEMRKFVRKQEIAWAQVCDGKGWDSPLAQHYGIRGVPTLMLLDVDGEVLLLHPSVQQIRAEIERRLNVQLGPPSSPRKTRQSPT